MLELLERKKILRLCLKTGLPPRSGRKCILPYSYRRTAGIILLNRMIRVVVFKFDSNFVGKKPNEFRLPT